MSGVVTKRLRCVDFVGWQASGLDFSFRHVARVSRQDEETLENVSLLACCFFGVATKRLR